MIDRNFQMIETNGVRLRTVVEGDGPLVILLHGWPQCWYMWRHQIDPIVAAGYRVAAPDQRGYGGSSKPPDVSDYNIRDLAADAAGIAPALGYDEFIVVGHDWGCVVAWHAALLHEASCRAVMGLSVPFWRLSADMVDPPGIEDKFWYMRYFKEPGVAETELEKDLARSLRVIYYGLSGDSPAKIWIGQMEHPRGRGLLDVLPEPDDLPEGLTPRERREMSAAVAKFKMQTKVADLRQQRQMLTMVLGMSDGQDKVKAEYLILKLGERIDELEAQEEGEEEGEEEG